MPTFNIKDYRPYSPVYCETGSCWGASLDRALKAGFKRLKSCEIHEGLYRHCIDRFKGKPVELFLGKSTDVLHKMLEDVYEPAVIFLDAHPAGPQTGGHRELLSGDESFMQHNILKNELEIILDHRLDHLIIIDDQIKDSYESQIYMDYISKFAKYRFEWLSEKLETTPLVENKILVCEPF